MKKLATSLLVWLLLLSLPFQAVAAAAMLPCAVSGQSHHEHHAADSTAASHHGSGVVHQNTHKAHAGCGACTACSPAVTMQACTLPPLSDIASDCDRHAFVPGFIASVDLAVPERPPSPLLA